MFIIVAKLNLEANIAIALFIWYKRIRVPLSMSDLSRSDDYNNKSMSFRNYVTKTDSRINKLTAIQS